MEFPILVKLRSLCPQQRAFMQPYSIKSLFKRVYMGIWSFNVQNSDIHASLILNNHFLVQNTWPLKVC